MYYPELDALSHEVAGKLAELRRLTMETPVLTEDQETLLAEITRLLRLADASITQQIHSLLGDTAYPDAAFLGELRAEFPLLQEPAAPLAKGHAPREAATPVLPPETTIERNEGQPLEVRTAEGPYALRWPILGRELEHQFAFCDINGAWFLVDGAQALRFASRAELDQFLSDQWQTERGPEALVWPLQSKAHEPHEVAIPEGMLELIYWDIRPVFPNNTRLLLARDAEQNWCLVVADDAGGHIALVFPTDEERRAYLDYAYKAGWEETQS